ncbi:alpha-isopropylmalate synthase regulatory domain-containing protein [Antrihabitans sp. YC2-6]|uniref:alpha-isopropylmalate synthase regulatory domain-containing protein n=1 Tax=Antrihabitans sp. YC2-6 TaxID=2799498 RepID=UPI001F1A963E|nr:alpha-isopropylmalate synthase regulatory domain-containing protein [Antrihabitans sp. YC2-6]
MPRGLRAQAQGMSWTDFVDRYSPSPSSGGLRLGSWSMTEGRAGLHDYDAILEFDGRTRAFRTSGPGPIGALTAVLHEAGRSIEILSFHQQPVTEGTATFVHCEHDGRRHWAMAISDRPTDSALRAVIAAANILTDR